jgi:hypothetical protein
MGDAFCRSCGTRNAAAAPPPPPPPIPPFSPGDPHTAYTYGGPARTNTLAVVSLVAAFVFWPAGIICGFIARSQIRTTGEAGDGMALAGIIISICAALLTALFVILFVTVFSHLLSCGGIPAPPGPGTHFCSNGVWLN